MICYRMAELMSKVILIYDLDKKILRQCIALLYLRVRAIALHGIYESTLCFS